MNAKQFQLVQSHTEFLCREHLLAASFEVVETHISYVLLASRYAYKIKKTVRLPFLDFSTLAMRKYYCEQELQLNRRLAPSVYLAVLPIKQHRQRLYVGEGEGETIDYALKMRRMDNRLEMDQMLKRKEVEEHHIVALAHRVADFHGAAAVVHPTYTVGDFQHVFNPLQDLANYLSQTIGRSYEVLVRGAIATATLFVREHLPLLQQRSDQGLVRDVHGDLHSRNIFLTAPPIIFDCLEFDVAYRQIDMLNEVAFLCMDLEAYRADALSQLFYQEYLRQMAANGLDWVGHDELLTYFKLYRANVRAKVLALQAKESNQPSDLLKVATQYLHLMDRYRIELEAAMDQSVGVR